MRSSLPRTRSLLLGLGLGLAGIGAAFAHGPLAHGPLRADPAGGSHVSGHPTASPAVAGRAGSLASGAGPRLPMLSRQPIAINAASVEVDYKTQTATYRQVVIAQGNVVVRADRARTTVGQTRQRSEWTLEGNVRIQAPPRGSLDADTATVDVQDSRIIRATVSGKPAEFTQQSAAGRLTQGHADRIVYDVSQGTVQLRQDAWLSDGRNEISGPLLTYDVLKDRIEASAPGSGERVHLTITPQAPSPRKAAPAAKPPARGGREPAKRRSRSGGSD